MSWAWLIIGFLTGMFLTVVIAMWCRFAGLIRIHPNDEDENRPYLFLELNDVPQKMMSKKYVMFRVKIDSRH